MRVLARALGNHHQFSRKWREDEDEEEEVFGERFQS
jgi:hypothetical protein